MSHRNHQGASPTDPSIAWVIAGTSIGFAMVQLDVSIVNVALPKLGSELDAGISSLQWVTDAYALAFAALLLSAGTLSDAFGARRAYVIGLFGFAAASAVCGSIGTVDQLIAGRLLQGAAAAISVPSSLTLLHHACAQDKRLLARAIGIWTAAAGVAVASGPVLGGLLLTGPGWRAIFFVNLPFCVLGSAIALRMAETPRKADHAFDVWGQLLAITTLGCLIASVIASGTSGGFDPLVICGWIAAATSAAAFLYVEARVPHPMLPLRFFRRPVFSTTVLFGVAINFTYYGLIFIISLYLQRVQGYAADRAGLAFLPLTATLIFANLLSGWMIGRFGSRGPMVLGAGVCSVGFLLLLRLGVQSSYSVMLLPFFLIPAGMGVAVPAMTGAMLSSVEKSWAGTASATLNSARQAGGAIGVAAFGALIAGGTERVVTGLHTAALLSAGMLALVAGAAAVGVGPSRE